jgi:hypothetical protein
MALCGGEMAFLHRVAARSIARQKADGQLALRFPGQHFQVLVDIRCGEKTVFAFANLLYMWAAQGKPY